MGRNLEFIESEAVTKAMNVFWEKGYNGASMRDLADAMQISISSMYNTLGDKKQLFLKCIKQYTQDSMQTLENKVAGNKSPLQSLIDIIEISAKTITESTQSCLKIKTAFEIGVNDKEVRQIVKHTDDILIDLLKDLIDQSQEQNEIKGHHDPEMLAEFIFNSFTGWHESYVINGDPVKIKKMAAYLVAMLKQ
jgi:TetR/AcrR family transcriptional repressor of nem operon